jgi:predicted amidophosphoribosyltransferase
VCAGCAGIGPLRVGPGPELVERVFAADSYDGPLGDVVRLAKGTGDRALARRLAACLGRRVAADPSALATLHTAALITWAPSPWTRRARRGFSMAAVLATELGGLTPTPVAQTLSARPGPRQASQGRLGRRQNLRGRIRATRAVAGRVILVEDVVTTGATATACARELIGAGASSVVVLAVCHVTDVVVRPLSTDPAADVQIS